MTDLERARRDLERVDMLVPDQCHNRSEVVSWLAEALAAARREGAEEMRERAARRAENLWFDARDTEWDEGVNCAKRRVAHAIRAVPLTPEAQ